jgi:WD40 repeat protein
MRIHLSFGSEEISMFQMQRDRVPLVHGLVLGMFLMGFAFHPVVQAQNSISSQEASTEQPSNEQGDAWLSSVSWLDDQTVLATQSQGLLLRPGKLVRIELQAVTAATDSSAADSSAADSSAADSSAADLSASAPRQIWSALGESETSLWSVLPFGECVLVSDYKGRILRYQDQEVTALPLESRWIRKLVAVPGQPSQLVAGTEDGKLIHWSVETGAEIQRAEIGGAAVFDIAFRPDSSQIAVACGDGSVHLRSWPSLEAVAVLKGQGPAVWAALYTASGQQLISAGADRKIRLWNSETGQPVVSLAQGRDWITSLVALPGSSLLAAGCLNGDVIVVDYETLMPVQTVQAAASGIWGMALSPNGKQLALGTRRHGLRFIHDWSPWLEASKAVEAAVAVNQPPEPKSSPEPKASPESGSGQ